MSCHFVILLRPSKAIVYLNDLIQRRGYFLPNDRVDSIIALHRIEVIHNSEQYRPVAPPY